MPKSIIISILLSAFVTNVQSTSLSFQITNISGNLWEYNYTVSYDNLDTELKQFLIFYDKVLYQNIVATNSPTDWDALTLEASIAPNTSLSSLPLRFNFLETGPPIAQPFEIISPISFTMIDTGLVTDTPEVISNPTEPRAIPTL